MNTGENGGSKNSNGMAKLLSQMNLPTVVMIILMGGGNLLTTQQTAAVNHREIERAIDEIHKIYANQERREQAYRDIEEINRLVKELRSKQSP